MNKSRDTTTFWAGNKQTKWWRNVLSSCRVCAWVTRWAGLKWGLAGSLLLLSTNHVCSCTWIPQYIKSSRVVFLPWEGLTWIQILRRAALSLNPPHKQPSLVYNSEQNSLEVWAGHARSLWASTVLHCPPILCLVISPCGRVQRIHPGVGTWVPSSHSWPRARVPSAPSLRPFSSYLPEKAEKEWVERAGAGNGEGHYMGAEEDGRSRRPLPWALRGISTVLAPRFVNGSLQMNGLSCPQTVGMNLSVAAGEQEGLGTAEWGMNETWTLPVPGEHPECSRSQVRGDWPHFVGESWEGCSACPHPVTTQKVWTEQMTDGNS